MSLSDEKAAQPFGLFYINEGSDGKEAFCSFRWVLAKVAMPDCPPSALNLRLPLTKIMEVYESSQQQVKGRPV